MENNCRTKEVKYTNFDEVNRKIDEFNIMNSVTMRVCTRPLVFIKKTINGSIVNRIEFGDTNEVISESDASIWSFLLENPHLISKIIVTEDTIEP